MPLKSGFLIFSTLLFSMSCHAANMDKKISAKSYTLSHLESAVSNGPACQPFYQALKQLEKNPIELAFKKNDKGELTVEDLSGQTSHHQHKMLKQVTKGSQLHRMAMGTFTFNQEEMDYLISVSGNAENSSHQYLYPIILESHTGQCYYTALVKPSEKTVSEFKKHLQSGEAAKNRDLAY